MNTKQAAQKAILYLHNTKAGRPPHRKLSSTDFVEAWRVFCDALDLGQPTEAWDPEQPTSDPDWDILLKEWDKYKIKHNIATFNPTTFNEFLHEYMPATIPPTPSTEEETLNALRITYKFYLENFDCVWYRKSNIVFNDMIEHQEKIVEKKANKVLNALLIAQKYYHDTLEMNGPEPNTPWFMAVPDAFKQMITKCQS